MVTRNVIIFGEQSINRRLVLKLLGISVNRRSNVLPHVGIFETQIHSAITTSQSQYMFYDTVGLDSDRLTFEPREALGNLYRFTRAFVGGVNLLIYVVGDRYSVDNVKLFHGYLCRQDVPIILVTTNLHPPPTTRLQSENLPHFEVVLTLTNPESEGNLRRAISMHIKRDIKNLSPIDRFEMTAKGFLKIMEKSADWSISDCRNAFKATLMEDAFFSDQDAEARCESILENTKKRSLCNVIVFGDTGAGKTSVIKMLTDKVEVDTKKASSAGGSTFESKSYEVDINEYHYVFHDTVGLEDGTSISLSPHEALKSLYQLIRKVEGGVSLLVYVHRGKIKPSQVENYKLFTHVICKSKVPTVLVVTGLEEEDSRDAWWQTNKALYEEQEIAIDYHACITSTKGRFNPKHQEFVYQDQYEESRTILKSLFLEAPLLNPWKIASTPNWWRLLVVEVYNLFAAKFKWKHLVANQALYHDLVGIGGMDEDQAKTWANNMDSLRPTRTVRCPAPIS